MDQPQRIDITSGTIFRVILVLVGIWFLYLIWDVILMLVAAIIVASAIEPIANYLQRWRVPRALSVVLVYLVTLSGFLGIGTLMIDPLTKQVRQLASALPSLITRVEEYLLFAPGVGRGELVTSLQQGLMAVGDNLAKASFNLFAGAGTVVADTALVIFVFVLAFYLVIEKDALKKFLRLVVPHEHWPFVEQVVSRAQRGVGRWLVAQVMLGLIVGTIVGMGLWLLGVPYALLLGLIAGVLEIIPVIGPIVAAIPGVIVGAAQSIWMGLILLAFYILVQQLENHILVPNIMRRAIGLHPLVTIIAVLLGARLVGVVGAILAVPIALVISIILSGVFKKVSEDELAG